MPDVVVFPENVSQISKKLKICNENKIPVIPYGVGSGFVGGINAIHVINYLFLNIFKIQSAFLGWCDLGCVEKHDKNTCCK
jgi:hypothetical protein